MSNSNKYFIMQEDFKVNKIVHKSENFCLDEDNCSKECESQNYKVNKLQECLFCFDNVDPNESFIGCDTCGKHCHIKCYIDWFNKKPDQEKICISCQQPTLVLSETRYTLMSRCFYWFIKKPVKYKKFFKIV